MPSHDHHGREDARSHHDRTGYKVFCDPAGRRVLADVGSTLPRAVGGLLACASTVAVALNARLLRRVDLRHPALATG